MQDPNSRTLASMLSEVEKRIGRSITLLTASVSRQCRGTPGNMPAAAADAVHYGSTCSHRSLDDAREVFNVPSSWPRMPVTNALPSAYGGRSNPQRHEASGGCAR